MPYAMLCLTAVLSLMSSLQAIVALPARSSPLQGFPLLSNITTTTNSHFGSHYGWVGFFNSSACEADPIGDRPKMNDQACHPVNPTNETRNVNIFWGDALLGFSGLDIFSDAECTAKIREITKGKGEDCFEMEDGEIWKSVKSQG